MANEILLGYESGTGTPIFMAMHHTVVTGMTQLSGKTKTLEAIIYRSGAKAIAFKTKRGETGFSSYHDIPPFFIQQSDWKYVSSLLEAMLRERMKFERSWIIKATKGTRTLGEVLQNVQKLKGTARKDSITESVYVTLEQYLSEIVPQIEKYNFTKELNLINGINVMDLSDMTLEMRSLVIRSVMEHVINHMNNIIIVIPEAWEYVPQGRATPVKLFAETFIRKGAAIGNYLLVDSQDVAGIDKAPLRSCDNWIMGRQKETHEVERVREIIGKNISEEEVRSLHIGHFIAYLGNQIRKVYVLPVGVPDEAGIDVAMGRRTPESVRDEYLSQALGDEEMWRKKCEEREEEIRKLNETIQELKEKHAVELSASIKDSEELESLRARTLEAEQKQKVMEEELKHLDTFKTALIEWIGLPSYLQMQSLQKNDVPGNLQVTVEQPRIKVKQERKVLVLTDKDLHGKIALLYARNELPTEWFTISVVNKLFETHSWPRDPRTNKILDEFVRWNYFQKRFIGKRPEYKIRMPVEEVKEKLLLIEET